MRHIAPTRRRRCRAATSCALLNVIDEYTRQCPAIVVARSIDADQVVATPDRLAVERGAPSFVRFDNGPEFIAHAVADWCRWVLPTPQLVISANLALLIPFIIYDH